MSHNIEVQGGTSLRLLTAGKYCDQDIVVTATGGWGSGESVDALAEEIRTLTGNPYLANEELQEQLNIFNQVPQSVSRKIYHDFNQAATAVDPSAKLLVFGEETGYDDVVHDAAMINIFAAANEGVVDYLEKIYTVVEDCTLMVIGAINNFETSQSLSQGSVVVNGTTVDSYTATSNKMYSYTLGTPYVFDAVAGDTIKFRTPSTAGWPKQYGCIYKANALPDAAVSLLARVLVEEGEILPWEQPESTNPYMAGDKVTHAGKVWVSDIDDNIWEPGVYGWTEVTL